MNQDFIPSGIRHNHSNIESDHPLQLFYGDSEHQRDSQVPPQWGIKDLFSPPLFPFLFFIKHTLASQNTSNNININISINTNPRKSYKNNIPQTRQQDTYSVTMTRATVGGRKPRDSFFKRLICCQCLAAGHRSVIHPSERCRVCTHVPADSCCEPMPECVTPRRGGKK